MARIRDQPRRVATAPRPFRHGRGESGVQAMRTRHAVASACLQQCGIPDNCCAVVLAFLRLLEVPGDFRGAGALRRALRSLPAPVVLLRGSLFRSGGLGTRVLRGDHPFKIYGGGATIVAECIHAPAGGPTIIEDVRFLGGLLSLSGDLIFKNCRFEDLSVLLAAKLPSMHVVFEDCTLKTTSLHWADCRATGTLVATVLDGNRAENAIPNGQAVARSIHLLPECWSALRQLAQAVSRAARPFR
mmetsp:Transcript_5629/g.13641  ORF Transcript_5629/g.13641 Transcript_5629/m.13641 type:complete len:244 (-) Transcript_5629:276-1007(-)